MNTPRDKVLARLANLLRLSKSSNLYEANLARERADDLVRKHGITDVEVAGVVAEPVQRDLPKYAGPISAGWHEQLAFAVSEKMRCRPLKVRERIFFDGESAAEAVTQYRRIADEIGDTCGEELREMRDPRAWLYIFRSVFQADGNPPPMSSYHQKIDTIVRRVWRAATESMVLKNGLVLVTARQPGNYATLFSPSGKFVCRGDLSAFDDAARTYTWAFEQRGKIEKGQHLVFATEDREIVGELTGTWIRIVNRAARVARAGTGEPMEVEGIL